MTRDDYDRIRREDGYGEPKTVSFEPMSRSATHTHDKASFVYVLEGDFILNTPDGAERYGPGETCTLAAHVEHAEEAGTKGATVLVARK